jgi:hypothetical protein
MIQADYRQARILCAMVSLLVAVLWCSPTGFAADPGASSSAPVEPSSQPAEAEDIQTRGLNPRPEKVPGGAKILPAPMQPGGGLPQHLCHQVTHMLTQCKCFNPAACQGLIGICPGACPAGSQSCECIPMSRGASPPLPPNLCGYQVPLTVTQCSCHNEADCQLLATVCPGSCPAGSHSCQCTPLQRGR